MRLNMQNISYLGQMTEDKPGELLKLDVKDRRILYELSKNARISLTSLAKSVGLSREVVNYRLDTLTKKGILTGHTALVDIKRLGKIKHIVYIQLQNFNKIWEKQLLNKLITNKNIIWVVSCGGKYDLGLLVSSNNIEDFDRIFNEITFLCGSYMNDYFILSEIKEDYLGLGLLQEGFKENNINSRRDRVSFSNEFSKKNKVKDIIQLNKKDKLLLNLMINDARKKIIDIANKLNSSPEFVKKRIIKFIREGLIFGFIPMISLSTLGYEWHMAFLRFNNINEIEERRFLHYIKKHPNILWYVKTIGKWNMELSVFAKNVSHFREIINELRTEFSNIIRDYDSLMIFNQYKYSHTVD